MPSVKSLIRRRQFKKSIPSILIFLSIVIIILSVYYVVSRQKQGQQEIQTCPECPQTLAPEERTPCPTNQDQRFSISNTLTGLYITATIGLAVFFLVGKFNKGGQQANASLSGGGTHGRNPSQGNNQAEDQIKKNNWFKLCYAVFMVLLFSMYVWLLCDISEQTDLSAMIGVMGILYILLPLTLYL